MPFMADHRHQYWTVDIRYIDVHQLGGGNPRESLRLA
jgi:hypothetical protein